MRHLTTIETLQPESIMYLIKQAQAYKQGKQPAAYPECLVSNLFFENSTRTHTSFEVAEVRMGMKVIQFDPAKSSVNKGETLYDTCLALDAIGINILVIRSQIDKYYEALINQPSLKCAIINGGDGSGQHPSQCLLDLMTIEETFHRFAGLNIVIAGDISHSRVARSNAVILNKLGALVCFSGPQQWIDSSFASLGQWVEFDEAIASADVVMLLRVQHERHDGTAAFVKEDYHQRYGLTLERCRKMKPGAIIMHPAPVNRDVEIAGELVEHEQSRIVTQMRNGVYMRMAILQWIIEGE